MRNSLVLMLIAFLFILQACGSKGEAYNSEWITKKISFEEEYICDCTEAEKESLKNLNHYKFQKNLQNSGENTYLKFNPDYTLSGTIMGENVSGTYQTTPGEVYLELDGYSDKQRLQIVRIGGEEFLQISLPEQKLSEQSDSFKDPNYGEVKVTFKKIKILLEQNN